MGKKFNSQDIKDTFKKVPTPVKQKVVKDLIAVDYTQSEIAEMFGVSAMSISKLKNAELNDDLLRGLSSEVDRLNKMKDVHIKALVKDLELNTYKKLQAEVGTASYKDALKTAELLRSETGNSNQPSGQTNIQIVMPDSVKKKFNLVAEEKLEQPLI